MRRISAIGVAAFTLVSVSIFSAGCSQQPTVDTPIERGKIVFAQKCQSCHMIDGVGKNKGPDLSTEGSARSEQWLQTYLKNPFAINPRSKMPRVQMTDKELQDVSAFLASKKGAAKDEQPRGKTD